MSQEYLDTIARFEPDVAHVDLTGAAASIAISLKRQADAQERIADLLEAVSMPDGKVITLPQILMEIANNLKPVTVTNNIGAPEKPS